MQVARLLQGEHERTAAGKLRQALRALELERRLSQGRDPAPLPAAGAVRRQPRGRARRLARLLRQGAAPAVAGRGGAAGRAAAVARAAPARPLPGGRAARPQPRAGSRRRQPASIPRRGGRRAPWRERMPTRAPRVPHAGPAPGRRRGRAGQDAPACIASPSMPPPRPASSSSRASTPPALGGRLSAALIARRPSHRRGRSPTSARPGYLDEDRFGAVDMTSAVRSPGSTLKPLIYGLAFEAGLAHPETLIEDRPARFGIYVPKNFDQDWHGTVTDPHGAGAVAQHSRPSRCWRRWGRPSSSAGCTQVGVDAGAAQGRRADARHRAGRPRPAGSPISPRSTPASRAAASPSPSQYRRDARRAQGAAGAASGCCRRSPPGTSPTSCATRRRRPTPSPARSPTRPAPPTASATPGRSASTAVTPSPCGSAGPMAPPRRASPDAPPPRRCCSTPSRGSSTRSARRCRPRPPARSASPAPTCRRRSSASARRSDETTRPRRLSRARRADRLPARPRRARGRGRRRRRHRRQGRGRRPAADLARRRRADRLRPRPARGRAAGRQPRLPSSSR